MSESALVDGRWLEWSPLVEAKTCEADKTGACIGGATLPLICTSHGEEKGERKTSTQST